MLLRWLVLSVNIDSLSATLDANIWEGFTPNEQNGVSLWLMQVPLGRGYSELTEYLVLVGGFIYNVVYRSRLFWANYLSRYTRGELVPLAKRNNKSKPRAEGRTTKSELNALGVRPSKERGQNFLINAQVLERIVEFGKPSPEEHIVEIGPGLGALTRYLTSREHLTVIEIEPAFVAKLRQEFPDISVIEGDFRKADLTTIGDDLTIFGNIPYVYSTEIIFALISQRSVVRRAVLLLQKEFAERVASPPGSRSYGVISVMTQLFCDMKLGPTFGGHEFFPPAAVQSRVLEISFLATPREPCDPRWLRRVVEGAFLKRRKMIHNSLKAASFPGAVVDAALAKLGIDPSRRAETLSLSEFVRLAEELRGGEENKTV